MKPFTLFLCYSVSILWYTGPMRHWTNADAYVRFALVPPQQSEMSMPPVVVPSVRRA